MNLFWLRFDFRWSFYSLLLCNIYLITSKFVQEFSLFIMQDACSLFKEPQKRELNFFEMALIATNLRMMKLQVFHIKVFFSGKKIEEKTGYTGWNATRRTRENVRKVGRNPFKSRNSMKSTNGSACMRVCFGSLFDTHTQKIEIFREMPPRDEMKRDRETTTTTTEQDLI